MVSIKVEFSHFSVIPDLRGNDSKAIKISQIQWMSYPRKRVSRIFKNIRTINYINTAIKNFNRNF